MSISVMKQALAALNYLYCPSAEWQDEVMEAALYALRKAIAETEKQKPVAWMEDSEGNKYPLPKQKEDWYGQHQWQCGYERGWDAAMEHKREWVGLTDEEVEAIYDQENHADVVLLTQAKLKEKNA